MKRLGIKAKQLMISGAIAALLGGGVWLSQEYNPIEEKKPRYAGLKESAPIIKKRRKQLKAAIGTKEDPNARLRYEFKRLRDPKTGKIPENIREKELAFSAGIITRESVERQLFPGAYAGDADWVPRGPYNVGGRTRALAIDVANENIILAGGVSGGMWRSTNNGSSWQKVTGNEQLHSVTTVSQDTRTGKRGTWYYGTGEYYGNSASMAGAPYLGNGIFKSIDNGVTWNQLSSTTSDATEFDNVFDFVWRVATNPANASQDEVYAATVGGIQRSTNGGTSWTAVLGGAGSTANSNSRYTDIDISSTGVRYATMSSVALSDEVSATKGIFRSTDGTTWTNITPSNFPATYERIVLDIAPSNENVVYFLGYTPGAGKFDTSLWKYTYVSGNGSGAGGTWVNLSNQIPAYGGDVGDFNPQGNYNLVVKVKPDAENTVVIGGTNLYRSTNGFATMANTMWIGGYARINNISDYPNHHPDQHAIAFYPSNPSRMISAHDGGLSYTTNMLATDTVRYTSLNKGYVTTQFYTVAVDPQGGSDNDILVGGLQDNGTWLSQDTDETSQWQQFGGGDGAYAAVTSNSIFTSSQEGTIYRDKYTEGYEDYVGYARIDPVGATGYLFINPYLLDPNNNNVMYLPAGDSLWRNSNLDAIPVGSGLTFQQQVSTNWSVISTVSTNQDITAVVVSTSPANVVYFGTDNGKVYKLTNAHLASRVRTEVTGTNFPTGAYVSSIAVDPNDANRAIVSFSNYGVISLFATTDGGTTWTAVAGNLEENADGSGNGPSARWVSIMRGSDGSYQYFVGTSTGLYVTGSLDGAATVWMKDGESTIGNVPVDMIITRTTDNLAVVGTHGTGAYSRRYTGPLATSEEIAQLTQKGLGQSYPNPFRQGGTTTIPYELKSAGQVVLQIFDVNGRQVTTLVNGKVSAGKHTVTWNGRGSNGQLVSSGTYLYQISIDGKRSAKRLSFIR